MTLADSQSLLGRLQRGRGDAVRELLAMEPDPAGEVLVDCLCTEGADTGELLGHRDGYVELTLELDADLSRWHRWIERLPPEAGEEVWMFPLHVLVESAASGHAPNAAFLRSYLLTGSHRAQALNLAVIVGCPIEPNDWIALLPEIDDDVLATFVGRDGQDWQAVAELSERVASIRATVERRRAAYADSVAWSAENYANAKLSQQRWRVLQDLMRHDPAAAAPLLVDGLWDGSSCYRERCIELCALDDPAAKRRVEELAADPRGGSYDSARRRLGLS